MPAMPQVGWNRMNAQLLAEPAVRVAQQAGNLDLIEECSNQTRHAGSSGLNKGFARSCDGS